MSNYRFIMTYNQKFHHLAGISINPLSWYHQCTKIDTRSGDFCSRKNILFMITTLMFKGIITLIVNGKVLLDEVISFFKSSYNVRPLSLEGM